MSIGGSQIGDEVHGHSAAKKVERVSGQEDSRYFDRPILRLGPAPVRFGDVRWSPVR